MKQTRMKQTRMKQTRIMETGYIKIKPDGVWFVYHELSYPDWDYFVDEYGNGHDSAIFYDTALKEYEASKREAKVNNWLTLDVPDGNFCTIELQNKKVGEYIWNNQPCEAEVKDNIATITKIT